MIKYEINDLSILSVLSKCDSNITMNGLYELIPDDGFASERAVNFIKTINQLRERELVETIHNSDGSIYWKITELGRQHIAL